MGKTNIFCTKILLLFVISFGIIISAFTRPPSFDWYMNPVIPGDHPDATLTRIGNDYYTTGSSFNITPVIYHSTDLVHWEAIAQPVKASWAYFNDKPGGGCWGGQMVYYNNKYRDYFSRGNTMYFVTADAPSGPWGDPVKVNNPSSLPYGLGYDNSIFIDDDNKWYLVVKNGQPNNGIVELGNDGQPTGTVYNLSWLNPSPGYPYSWAEGPVMWKYGGYYYYSFARDLGGGQKVMRSRALTADEESWEMLGDFFNLNDPQRWTSLFTTPNHASASILIDDSTSWAIHPLYASGEWKGQGRQGLLNQVRYGANLAPVADYPVNKAFTAPKLSSSGIPWMVPKSDFFTSGVLTPEWSFLGQTADNTHSLSDRPGWFHLSPKSSTKGNTIIKNDGEHNYSLITRVEFDPAATSDQAGLQIMRGDETKFVKLSSTQNIYGHKIISLTFGNVAYEAENTYGNTVWLKLVRVNHNISGYFSKNGYEWAQVGKSIDISVIDSYSDYSTFTGTRQGLFVQGKDAYFDFYIYRDAYTPILAECPANQYGTVRSSKAGGIYQLDSINNNDWALYAGVEFGNKEYPRAPKTVEITASCGGTGGTVEVWLDSIDTGTKIADCAISGTGDWDTFKTFSAPVNKTQNRHDVYLRFKGTGAGRLFKLKWIQFISGAAPAFIDASIINDDTLLLKLSQPVITPSLPSGLKIVANGAQDYSISNISLASYDSSQLKITLTSTVTSADELTISYGPGSVTNVSGLGLSPFLDEMVNNLLPGAVPQIKFLETRNKGDTVWVQLSKKMNPPEAIASDFFLTVQGSFTIGATSAGLSGNDPSLMFLIPNSKIHYEDIVSLTYTGSGLESENGGKLGQFTSKPVINLADGYPPQIISAILKSSGSNYKYIDLILDRIMKDSSAETSDFSITLNDIPATIQSINTHGDTLSFSFSPAVQFGDVIKISYSGGDVRSFYNGKLENFTGFNVENIIQGSEIKENNNDNASIKVYPNPAHSELKISWDTKFNSLAVYSDDGKTVLQKKFGQPVQITDISLNSPGIYFIRLESDGIIETKKLIVK